MRVLNVSLKKGAVGPFSILQFCILVFGWSMLLLFGIWFFSPVFFWEQWASHPARKLAAFAAVSLVNGFVEYFLHRYGLHSIPAAIFRDGNILFRFVLRANAKFTREHRHHHALTPEKHYAITAPDQHASSRFPFWTLPVLFGLYAFPLVPLQQIFPRDPCILMGYAAVTFSYAMYEIRHALHHRPYQGWWKAWVEAPGWRGALGKNMHVGHRLHHSDPKLNLNVWGVFGFPLVDWLFRTLDLAREVSEKGELLTVPGRARPKPVWFIDAMDRWTLKHEKALRSTERT